MKNLSNREKTLLKLLGIILFIAVFGVLIIKPQLEQLDANKIELQETEIKKQELDSVLSRYGKQDVVIKEKTDELNLKDDYIISARSNEEIEKFIMDFAATECGLDITTLIISQPSLTKFDAYTKDETEINNSIYNLKEYYESVNGEKEIISSNVVSKDVSLLKNTIQISFDCDFGQYKDFITKINDSNLSFYVVNGDVNYDSSRGVNTYYVILDFYSVEGKE